MSLNKKAMKRKIEKERSKNLFSISDAFEQVLKEKIEPNGGAVVVFLPRYVEGIVDAYRNKSGGLDNVFWVKQLIASATLPPLDFTALPVFDSGVKANLADVYIVPILKGNSCSLLVFSIVSNSPLTLKEAGKRGVDTTGSLEIVHYFASDYSIDAAEEVVTAFEAFGIFYRKNERKVTIRNVKISLIYGGVSSVEKDSKGIYKTNQNKNNSSNNNNNNGKTKGKSKGQKQAGGKAKVKGDDNPSASAVHTVVEGVGYEAGMMLNIMRSYFQRDWEMMSSSPYSGGMGRAYGYMEESELTYVLSDVESFVEMSEWVYNAMKNGLPSNLFYFKTTTNLLADISESADYNKNFSVFVPGGFLGSEIYDLIITGTLPPKVLEHYLNAKRWISTDYLKTFVFSEPKSLLEDMSNHSEMLATYRRGKSDLFLAIKTVKNGWISCCVKSTKSGGAVMVVPSTLFKDNDSLESKDLMNEFSVTLEAHVKMVSEAIEKVFFDPSKGHPKSEPSVSIQVVNLFQNAPFSGIEVMYWFSASLALLVEVHRHFAHEGVAPSSNRLDALFGLRNESELAEKLYHAQELGSSEIIKTFSRELVAWDSKVVYLYSPKAFSKRAEEVGIPTVDSILQNPTLYAPELEALKKRNKVSNDNNNNSKPKSTGVEPSPPSPSKNQGKSTDVKFGGPSSGWNDALKQLDKEVGILHQGVPTASAAFKIDEKTAPLTKNQDVKTLEEAINRLQISEEDILGGAAKKGEKVLSSDNNEKINASSSLIGRYYRDLEDSKTNGLLGLWFRPEIDSKSEAYSYASQRNAFSLMLKDIMASQGLFLQHHARSGATQEYDLISKIIRGTRREATNPENGNPLFVEFAMPLGIGQSVASRGVPKNCFVRLSSKDTVSPFPVPKKKTKKNNKGGSTLDLLRENAGIALKPIGTTHRDNQLCDQSLSAWKWIYSHIKPSHWGNVGRMFLRDALIGSKTEGIDSFVTLLDNTIALNVPIILKQFPHKDSNQTKRVLINSKLFAGVDVEQLKKSLSEVLYFDTAATTKVNGTTSCRLSYTLEVMPIVLRWRDPQESLSTAVCGTSWDSGFLSELVKRTKKVDVDGIPILKTYLELNAYANRKGAYSVPSPSATSIDETTTTTTSPSSYYSSSATVQKLGLIRALFSNVSDVLNQSCAFDPREKALALSHPDWVNGIPWMIFLAYLTVLKDHIIAYRDPSNNKEKELATDAYRAINVLNDVLNNNLINQTNPKERRREMRSLLEACWKISLTTGL